MDYKIQIGVLADTDQKVMDQIIHFDGFDFIPSDLLGTIYS